MSRFSRTSVRLSPMPRTADIDHGAGQIICANHLAGEHHAKRGIDRAQHAIAEIRLLARLDRIDVRGPEDVNAGESRRQQPFLRLSLVAREGRPTLSVWSAPIPLKNENAALGTACRARRARTRSRSPR